MGDEINKKLCSLSEISKQQLSKILNSVPGQKDLTLQPEIIKPLERICGVSWLKLNSVEKIYKLESNAPKQTNLQFYMIYSKLDLFKQLIDLIQSQIDQEHPDLDKYHIICVPYVLDCFEILLEELGLFMSVVKLYSFSWLPIFLDSSVLTLEIPGLFKSLYITKDLSLLPTFARSLWHLSLIFGKPQFMLGLGHYAQVIIKQFNDFYNCDERPSDFNALIILDRNLDYPSTLLTPCTYTGLINEVYSINCGVCEFKSPVKDTHDAKNNLIVNLPCVQFALDGIKDTIYAKIKHSEFVEVTSTLSALTKELKMTKEASREMALDQIKNYIKTQLQATTSMKKNLSNHLLVAEAIVVKLGAKFEKFSDYEANLLLNKNRSSSLVYLEDYLQTQNDRITSLAMFCLFALTQKLTNAEIKSFLNKYMLEFGYSYGFIYRNLIKSGFIQEFTPKNKLIKLPTLQNKQHTNAAQKLDLIPNPDAASSSKCCSKVFGGVYIPLIAQIVSMILGGTPISELKAKLGSVGMLSVHAERHYPPKKKNVLVYMIGGITYSELAALSLLEELLAARIVVVSDMCIARKDIVDGLLTI